MAPWTDEEKEFLGKLTNRVWRARRQGLSIGIAFSIGVAFLLYLARDNGWADPMSAFLYAGIGVMIYTLWTKVLRKP
mgnify:CR=1 FL=1